MPRNNFHRTPRKREQRKRYLIVVEGKVTEYDYFTEIRTSRRISTANIKVIPPGPTSPVEIVKEAIQRKKSAISDPYDEVWCVFDAEANSDQPVRPGYSQALSRAKQKHIQVARSNPCFEFWILLHSENCTGPTTSEQAQEKCSRLGLVRDKKILNLTEILNRHETARDRARALTKMHDRDKTTDPADRNPETTVHLLVDSIFDAFPYPGR